MGLGGPGNLDGAEDGGAGEDGDAQAEGVFEFVEDALLVVGFDGCVDDEGMEAGFAQSGSEGEEADGWPERLSVVRRVKQDDL
jgi:hypothetical protein